MVEIFCSIVSALSGFGVLAIYCRHFACFWLGRDPFLGLWLVTKDIRAWVLAGCCESARCQSKESKIENQWNNTFKIENWMVVKSHHPSNCCDLNFLSSQQCSVFSCISARHHLISLWKIWISLGMSPEFETIFWRKTSPIIHTTQAADGIRKYWYKYYEN